jgi:hypothetical protein
MGTTSTIAEAIRTKIKALHHHEQIPATPPATGTIEGPEILYFPDVWIGMPPKIPMGTRNVCIIELSQEPTFYYSTCPELTQNDRDYNITIMSKGSPETAHLNCYDLTDLVKTNLLTDPKISTTCADSTIETVIYGDIIDTGGDNKNLITASRITLRCKK